MGGESQNQSPAGTKELSSKQNIIPFDMLIFYSFRDVYKSI